MQNILWENASVRKEWYFDILTEFLLKAENSSVAFFVQKHFGKWFLQCLKRHSVCVTEFGKYGKWQKIWTASMYICMFSHPMLLLDMHLFMLISGFSQYPGNVWELLHILFTILQSNNWNYLIRSCTKTWVLPSDYSTSLMHSYLGNEGEELTYTCM